MKKGCLTVVLLLLFSSIGFASPLMDYSQGKGAIDLSLRPSNNLDFGDGSLDGNNSNFDGGITFGLGNKFAFQWLNQNSKSKTYSGTISDGVDTATGSVYTKLTANQFNLLYKLDKNFATFAGFTQAKNDLTVNGTFNGSAFSGTAGGKTINGWQLGFVGSFPMGENFTGYGTVGFGNKIENFEVGVSYAMAKNTELNLFYKSVKYKDLEFEDADGKYDLKVDGLGAGITFKF